MLEIVAAEAAANVAMITLGASTASALVPVAPALVAAKLALEAVNAMADLVGF